jgi:DNA mismatch repair protein MSH3
MPASLMQQWARIVQETAAPAAVVAFLLSVSSLVRIARVYGTTAQTGTRKQSPEGAAIGDEDTLLDEVLRDMRLDAVASVTDTAYSALNAVYLEDYMRRDTSRMEPRPNLRSKSSFGGAARVAKDIEVLSVSSETESDPDNEAAIAGETDGKLRGNSTIPSPAAGVFDLGLVFHAETLQQSCPEVVRWRSRMREVQDALAAELLEIRRILKRPSLQFTTLRTGPRHVVEYLIELRRVELASPLFPLVVPSDWTEVSSTGLVRRFHTPAVLTLVSELALAREMVDAESHAAWQSWVRRFASQGSTAISALLRGLADLDALFSLSMTARCPGYTRPVFVHPDRENSAFLHIVNGRHPVMERARNQGLGTLPMAQRKDIGTSYAHTSALWMQKSIGEVRSKSGRGRKETEHGWEYIPSSIALGTDPSLPPSQGAPMLAVITGPNAGGKTTVVRMAACLAILAQIGAYVPAQSLRMIPLDAIHTRMGSGDDLLAGRSTFFVEASQTAVILESVAQHPRALCIFDELGRGTSTCDGTAIALATLRHMSLRLPHTLGVFITHYPELGRVVKTGRLAQDPKDVGEQAAPPGGFADPFDEWRICARNYHMGYVLDGEELVFLYQLRDGPADGSYGLKVARLAGMPASVLAVAERKRREVDPEAKEY